MTARVVRARLAILALAALVAAGGAVVATAPPAAAASRGGPGSGGPGAGLPTDPSADAAPPVIPAGTSLAAAQQWVEQALNLRQSKLTSLAAQVDGVNGAPPGDRPKLDALISTATTGIGNLLTTVQGATTLAEARTAAASMVLTYRVLSVLSPQVKLVLRCDGLLVPAEKLQALEPGIEALITTEHASKQVTRRAQSLYRDFAGRLQSVVSAVGSLDNELLAETAASYPGALGVFAAAKPALASATTQLGLARVDLRQMAALFAGARLSAAPGRRRRGAIDAALA